MRFFASDGKTISGPFAVEELLQRPDFDGNMLVCPVGSENSADWKPALAYPPLRDALLSPAPKIAAPPPARTEPCPSCGKANPEKARFCNDCGERMDGTRPQPALGPMSKPAPMSRVGPMAGGPMSGVGPMGRTPAPAPEPIPAEAPPAVEAAPPPVVLAPEPVVPAPASAAARAAADAAWRKTLIAAFVGAVAASGGLGWWLLRPAKRAAPAGNALNLTPPPASSEPVPETAQESVKSLPIAAPTPSPFPATAPAAPVRASKTAAPPSSPAPIMTEKPAPKRVRRKPIAHRAKPARQTPPPAAKASAPLQAPTSADAPDEGMIMPGVPRRVTSKPAAKAGKGPAAPAAAPDAPAASDGASGDASAVKQVREQFEFCAQLLAQSAFADHFDTCLCGGAKQAAPYFGNRDAYAAELRKSAATGKLETSAKVSDISIDGGVAKVTATWTTRGGGSRDDAESWQLEDGLWCRAP